MHPPDRPSEGKPDFWCLIIGLGVVVIVGGLAIVGHFNQRSQRLVEEKAAAQKKEAAANKLVSELTKLAPGKIDEFNATDRRRQEFVRENPSFREQLDSAEDKWLKRTLASVEGKVAADPAAAIAGLRQLQSGCQKGSGQRLLPQVRQALERAVGSAAKQSAGLLERDSVKALDLAGRCLASFDNGKEDPPTPLIEARQRALDHCVGDLLGRLKKIPVDDALALASWLKARQAVEKAARADVAPLRQAEERWLAETIAAVLKEIEPQAAEHPEKVFARLARTRATYADLFADHPDVAKALTAGEERRLLQGVVDYAVAEARKQGNPAAASARLRRTATICARLLQIHAAPAKTLTEARREVVNGALKKAGAEAYHLIKGDQFQAAASLSERVDRDFRPEAEAVGLASALIQFRDECGYFADLARQAQGR